MGLSELKSGNTKKAKATAANTFMRFLETKDVGIRYVKVYIDRDETGKVFVCNGQICTTGRRSSGCLIYSPASGSVQSKLIEMVKTLENYCVKLKGDSKNMFLKHYQDAALLCLMWYLFGLAYDVALVHKQNVSVNNGNVFFLKFLRMKTCEEQGLSIFPSFDFVTCPPLAIALAPMTQEAPSSDLIDNLPALPAQASLQLCTTTPLVDILDNIEVFSLSDGPTTTAGDRSPTSYSHVDRITTNKGFSYVFVKITRYQMFLSGWSSTDRVPMLDLSSFDSETQDRVKSVQSRHFVACFKLSSCHLNVNQQVLNFLTAYLVRHYQLLKAMNATRLEA